MERILGIDTGTNSLGWAIVDKEESSYRLIDKGVNIFQEGVKIEKGIESSKASERTDHRSIRKLYYRRKLRKIRVLRVLSDNHLCPPLSQEDLSMWRLHKKYPIDNNFIDWEQTDDKENKNPYYYRYLCVTKKLDLNKLGQRYILGRAFYHIAQRRGFLSNRKETTKESDGTVKLSIDELSTKINDSGCKYLGEYFYSLYQKGEKIRNHYTARKEHYLKEFKAICEIQGIDEELAIKIEKAIFTQRPLKSQKGQVGTCTFEKGKSRCSASHPYYEEFRMLCFINNIKVKTPQDDDLRLLTKEEKELIAPLFYRVSKKNFNFEDIAKKIAGKNNYGYYKKETYKPYLFNYQIDTSVSGCPVLSQLRAIFGDNWIDTVSQCYTLKKDKKKSEIVNDIWHALFFYSDEDKLKGFAGNRLQLDEEKAEKFAKIAIPSDYASLSLKAIRNILPYLRKGLPYSHAVFLGNLGSIIPHYIWEIDDTRGFIIDEICKMIDQYDPSKETGTLDQCIKGFLNDNFDLPTNATDILYHPSMMDAYPKVRPNDLGEYQLGSPRTGGVKNPMAMHSLFRLRKVINQLLKEKKIDNSTTIHVEFARELNDANKRKAINDIQRSNQKKHDEYKNSIKEQYKAEAGIDIEPNDSEVLKYELWEEQNHICLYTGETIRISDFIGANPKYDIEHTIPQSVGGDSTVMNLTLCNNRFNRETKGTKLPSQLPNHEEILERIEDWKDRYESLEQQIRRTRANAASSKEQKDTIIQKRHRLSIERNYWKSKYIRFTMTEIPEGFSRRQGTDIGIISKYARLYLKSVFPKVYVVKGLATSDFRKIWGLQEDYVKKERVNHVHHCIDAITIACIGKNEYDKLAQYYHDEENHKWFGLQKAQYPKPWATFTEDLKNIQQEILIAHYNANNLPKQSKHKIKMPDGSIQYAQGDTARGSLHNDTYYGAIQQDGQIKYVVRKQLKDIKESDIANIVDDVVRQKVMNAITEKGFKTAMSETIWMNEEKQIPIKKVRCYTPSVTNPLNIRNQRNQSQHEYKRTYHVTNDRNYMLAIYIGKDNKGKEKREFELVNNLDAAAYYKRSNDKELTDHQLVPQISKSNYPLAYCLKIGTRVLLYEKSPSEIWENDLSVIQQRLYKVTGLSSLRISKYQFGTIKMVHHEEARTSSLIQATTGIFKKDAPFRPGIFLYHTQINALVEGYDFEINELGILKRLRQ